MKSDRMSGGSRLFSSLAGLAAALALGGLSGSALAAGAAPDTRAACGSLEEKPLGDPVTGLPVEGASIESARPAEAGCTVTARIVLDGNAAPLRFELRLPAEWNLRGVQFATGLGAGKPAAIDPAQAVAAGFALFGPIGSADAGGGVAAGSDDAALAAQKKIRDVAAELLARRFSRFPDRFYFVAGARESAEQALALITRFPRAYRGVLVDASGAERAAPAQQGEASRPIDYSAAVAPFAAQGGKILILAPAAEEVASSLPVVEFERDQVRKKGRRYAEDFVRLYSLPDAAAAGAVAWLPVLVDWAENLKAPAALPDLSRR